MMSMARERRLTDGHGDVGPNLFVAAEAVEEYLGTLVRADTGKLEDNPCT